jgi:iron complex outermembrane receptor protein
MLARNVIRQGAVSISAVISLQCFANPNEAGADAVKSANTLETVVVSGTREQQLLAETPASIGVISDDAIRSVGPTHPQQILSQVPGVAVAVTNGEGHTTAIRQPFTTAPLYLYLEDGVPIRATGFFNHNALYEVDIPMAGGIEVTRGPGSALYGSDAIGGVINILTRKPSDAAEVGGALELGSFGWRRALMDGDTGFGNLGALHGGFNITHTDGWRDVTAYNRQSVDARWDVDVNETTKVKTVLAGGRIDQETGANSPLIYSDYQNNPTKNNFPIAYRNVDALRLSVDFEKRFGDGALSVIPYLRDNEMELLASFALSSDPTVYTSANQSVGMLAKWRQDFPSFMRARLIAGVDIDYSPGSREENRLAVSVSGTGASRVYSAYTVGARVYDYDVTYESVSPYLHGEISPLERLRVTVGLRYDTMTYELENNLVGATVQGAPTAFYGQAPNTTVDFDHVTPKIGATYALTDNMNVYASYNAGFRAPSEGQLFRASVDTSAIAAANKAQLALNLKPINATQFELGWRATFERWTTDLTVFELTKRDDLVSQRDLATNVSTSVNAGKTSHRGVELGAGLRIIDSVRIDTALSYTHHKYVDWVTATADFSGKEMEAAPRDMANTRLSWTPLQAVSAQLEWIHIGSYWLEASNSAAYPQYPGHDLLNVRAQWQIVDSVSLFGRILNVADKRYADSSQVSSSTPVYSPGLPRTYYAGVDLRW